MTADLDIFVGNHLLVDPDVYALWVSGHAAHEAAILLQKRGVLQQHGASFDLLFTDLQDNYRTFAMLERLLHSPPKMIDQLTFQIAPETRSMLIQRYYEFDEHVVREILGKKLSSRTRNSLDEVSEKTKIPIRSCRRQFDNIKRVFKVVEEMMGSLVENIRTHFLLPDFLARQYTAIVFITNVRFETSKKKLLYLTFDDFVHCANQMIQNWSYSSKDCKDHEDMDVDFHQDFLHRLRELKVLAEKELMEEHKTLTTSKIRGKLSTTASTDLDNNFKTFSKHLVNIAYGLNHSKEMRDLFLDLVEQFIEPCRQSGWTQDDVKLFLKTYTETAYHLDILAKDPELKKEWDRYMQTVSSCICQMYHT